MGSTKRTGSAVSDQVEDASLQAHYPETRWTLVAGFLDSNPARFHESLEWLCRRYRQPLLNFLRNRGESPENAEDLIHGFIVHLLDKDRLPKVKVRTGRFRSFLLAELKNYRVDVWRRGNSQKAGGSCQTSLEALSEDDCQVEPASPARMTPEQVFDREWAREIFATGLKQLREEEEASGEGDLFCRLQPVMSGDRANADYATIGADFGLTETVVKKRVQRLRSRYKDIVRRLVSQTVGPDCVDDELRHLKDALRS